MKTLSPEVLKLKRAFERSKPKMTWAALSAETKLSKKTLWQIFTGRTPSPRLETLQKIAKPFGQKVSIG